MKNSTFELVSSGHGHPFVKDSTKVEVSFSGDELPRSKAQLQRQALEELLGEKVTFYTDTVNYYMVSKNSNVLLFTGLSDKFSPQKTICVDLQHRWEEIFFCINKVWKKSDFSSVTKSPKFLLSLHWKRAFGSTLRQPESEPSEKENTTKRPA